MKITIIGTGYVGLVTGACLSEMGNHVVCLDLDARKIDLLESGGMPIYEPGLPEMVRRNRAAGRLQFTTDVEHAVAHGSLQFIAVGTPADEDGSADLRHVLAAAREIGRLMTDYKVIVDKSTVPVGTADQVRDVVRAQLRERQVSLDFSVVSNPEFLKEGDAVADFMRPDRVIVGADDDRAMHMMRAIYAPFIRNRDRMIVMDVRSAEFTKYAANAMLATRISFMNDLARLADRVGVDIEWVRQGIGADPRIGTQFLYAGAGFGGSCFPKDLRALAKTAAETGHPLQLLPAVEAINQDQKLELVRKIVERLGEDLTGIRLAIWGLAYKPNTDDMREAPSRTILPELARRGAQLQAYDPVANAEAARALGPLPGLSFVDSAQAALDGADALVLITEWKEFRTPDFIALGTSLAKRLVFDGRNQYDPRAMAEFGLEYHCIGRPFMAPRRTAKASEREPEGESRWSPSPAQFRAAHSS